MRILCIPYSHTYSHLSRPFAVALELRRRGHEIHFAGESDKLRQVMSKGFQVHPLFEPDPAELFDKIRTGKLRFVSSDILDRMIAADLDLAKRLSPDVVLTDGRFSAGISMQIAGCRHAAIVNVSSCEYRAQPYIPFFGWIPQMVAPDGGRLRALLDNLNLTLEMAVFDAAMSDFVQLSRKYGLKKTMTATNCLTGADLTLLADIPEYFPVRTLPADYRLVGPLAWPVLQKPPQWWPPARRKGPLIYVTMGTTGIPGFFQMLIDMLEEKAMNAVITTGGQAMGVKLPSPFIHLEDFMNAEEVVCSCDAVICHGGNGTIYQALRHGKPIVGIPTIPDQKFNMRRVEALGAGLSIPLKKNTWSTEVLKASLRRILEDDGFRVSAGRLGAILQSYDAPAACADAIEQLGGQ